MLSAAAAIPSRLLPIGAIARQLLDAGSYTSHELRLWLEPSRPPSATKLSAAFTLTLSVSWDSPASLRAVTRSAVGLVGALRHTGTLLHHLTAVLSFSRQCELRSHDHDASHRLGCMCRQQRVSQCPHRTLTAASVTPRHLPTCSDSGVRGVHDPCGRGRGPGCIARTHAAYVVRSSPRYDVTRHEDRTVPGK